MAFKDASIEEIDSIMKKAWSAFEAYKNFSFARRSAFMKTIAAELESLGDEVIKVAMKETHLPDARLRNERMRTMFQLTSYADAVENASWMDLRIDNADGKRAVPKPDIRKTMTP